MKNIVVATIHDWNLERYRQWKPPKGYQKFLISEKSDLNSEKLGRLKPEFIFFPHWSWKIPDKIFRNYNCVVFHMTDLPFGRGGTPLQNLLTRGIYKTKISAIKVSDKIDAGPVYLKKDFLIKSGSAAEIYDRASELIFRMMSEIIEKNLLPQEQEGKVVNFKRRTQSQSLIPSNLNLNQLYDYIRMLDAPNYPKAFLKNGNLLFEFSDAKLLDRKLFAKVEITKLK